MPVHVERMTSEVIAFEGELPLNPQQIEKLVQLVVTHLETREREKRNGREATEIRHEAAPPR